MIQSHVSPWAWLGEQGKAWLTLPSLAAIMFGSWGNGAWALKLCASSQSLDYRLWVEAERGRAWEAGGGEFRARLGSGKGGEWREKKGKMKEETGNEEEKEEEKKDKEKQRINESNAK